MATVNDLNVPYGSVVLTINGSAFVAENLTETEPSTTIEVRDELGAPSDQVIIPGFVTGTTVLQFATTIQAAPTIGATFGYTPNGGSIVTYYVSEVGRPISQMEIKKVNISFRKKLN